MARRVSDDTASRIAEAMFRSFENSDKDNFLKKEFQRYIPLFSKWENDEIANFLSHQRAIWLGYLTPTIGKPVLCLNPAFIAGVNSIKTKSKGFKIYIRGSTKENGYRFQLHNGPQKSHYPNASAFTRQLTTYDLYMFPELHGLFKQLPTMIGDTELINKLYQHYAGFKRVQERIPGTNYWPKKGLQRIDDTLLMKYFQNEFLFNPGRQPKEEFELTLAFHGLFSIAHPKTWDKPKEKQMQNMISVCSIPMNYKLVDELLDQLGEFIEKRELNAKVVERKVFTIKKELRKYVKDNEKAGLEGTVIVQYAEDSEGKPSVDFAKSIKIKKYETIDTILLGIYLGKKDDDFAAENMKYALLGLWDASLECYLPVCKVNLDPEGKQIHNDDQRERLIALREDIEEILSEREEGEEFLRLQDAYLMQIEKTLGYALEASFIPQDIGEMFETMPKGQDFVKLQEIYKKNKKKYETQPKKSATKRDKWIFMNRYILNAITALDPKGYNSKKLTKNFKKASEVKEASKNLDKPHFIVDTSEPIIIEAKVFGIDYKINPFPAGWHSDYCDSFFFDNKYAERIRYDKISTTDYKTVQEVAKQNKLKKRKK